MTVGIGTPIVVTDPRHPDIAVVRLIGPAAGIGQLGLIFGVFGREIALPDRPGIDRFAGVVPGAEIISGSGQRGRILDEPAVGRNQALAAPGDEGALLAGSLGLAFEDEERAFPAVAHIETVQALAQDVERGVGRIDLEIARPVERVDADENAAGEKVDLGRLPVRPRQGGHLDHGVVVETEIVLPAELELEPSGAGTDLVSRDDDEVHLPGLEAEILASLDVNVSLDVAHPDVAPIVIPGRLSDDRGGG